MKTSNKIEVVVGFVLWILVVAELVAGKPMDSYYPWILFFLVVVFGLFCGFVEAYISKQTHKNFDWGQTIPYKTSFIDVIGDIFTSIFTYRGIKEGSKFWRVMVALVLSAIPVTLLVYLATANVFGWANPWSFIVPAGTLTLPHFVYPFFTKN